MERYPIHVYNYYYDKNDKLLFNIRIYKKFHKIGKLST